MIVVMQCAGSKNDDAGYLTTKNGTCVSFVGNPHLAPKAQDIIYACPDDPSDQGESWREVLVDYNQNPGNNSLKLLPAFELYKNSIYRDLVDRLGTKNVFILSAGWGLIPADFLTPSYDITFSASAPSYVRRRKNDVYKDFSLLPEEIIGPIIFFGSKDYAPLFASLTRAVKCDRIIFYNSTQPPLIPGCSSRRFKTTTRTNWQYECAKAFLANEL